MSKEDREIIAENLLNLFKIMNDKGGMIFVKKIEEVCGKSKTPIGELVRSASDVQLAELMKCAANLKYKEDPKSYFDKIIKIIKDNYPSKK